jgi:hypothetical protein
VVGSGSGQSGSATIAWRLEIEFPQESLAVHLLSMTAPVHGVPVLVNVSVQVKPEFSEIAPEQESTATAIPAKEEGAVSAHSVFKSPGKNDHSGF